ncbi:MAG: hypothetical protein ACKORK_04810, partial [Gemmatimonadota bacterium]
AADLEVARFFIPMAMRRTRRAIRALERNADDAARAIATRALETGDLTVPTPTDTLASSRCPASGSPSAPPNS